MERLRLLLASVLAVLTVIPGSASAPPPPIVALAPMDVLAAGLAEPLGLAVDHYGDVHVSDRKDGTVARIDAAGRPRILVRGLRQPAGLAFDSDGRLLVAELGRDRVLRRERSGALTVLGAGIRKPRWLAVAPDDSVYVTAKGVHGRERDEDEGDDEDGSHVVARLQPGAAPAIFADGFAGLGAIAIHAGALFAATERVRGDAAHRGASLVRVSIGPGGQPGARQVIARIQAHRPSGLVVDRLGGVFVAVEREQEDRDREREARRDHGDDRGALVKPLPNGRVVTFAAGLRKPGALALAPEGHLLAVDGADGGRGRVLRFRAPAAPDVQAPAFTNRAPVTVAGTADVDSDVAAYRADDLSAALASAPAGPPSGRFTLLVPLVPNAEHRLEVVATGARGLGLTGASADIRIVHDDFPPGVRILQPLGGAFVRQAVTLTARATDDGSGVASVVFTLDGRAIATLTNPDPAQAFAASVLLDSTQVDEGVHTLGVAAHDRAGNVGSAGQSLVVDNTAPETEITAGPAGEVGGTEVAFGVTGLDALSPTPSLQFAWRLDGGAWSPFGPETTITPRGLSEGPHLFEVKARDLAGNEDATPARRAFTVSLLGVTITEPADGATVAEGVLLVRGTVRAGGVEVGVTVNDAPAAVQGTTFAALVPIRSVTTALTARATTARGQTTSHQVAIAVVSAPAPPVVLYASPSSGVAPLVVRFSLFGAPVVAVELDHDGDGGVDFRGPRLDEQELGYDRPGLYVARVTAADTLGNRLTATAVVEVFDQAALDRTLTAKWMAMKNALRAGDVAGALEHIVPSARNDYRDMLTGLGSQLAQIDLVLTDISAVSFDGRRAEYQMIRVDDGVRLSYFILFVHDADGLWRLKFF